MAAIQDIALAERRQLAPLFSDHAYMRVCLDCILQGYAGRARIGGERAAARIELGPFTYFGGDPSSPDAKELLAELKGPRLLLLPTLNWQGAAREHSGPAMPRQHRISFSNSELNPDHLHGLVSRTPAGSKISRMDAELASRSLEEVHPDLLVDDLFKSPADLVSRGVGYCAIEGARITCAATSGIVSDAAIEIQINTHPDHQRRGLARAVAATLMLHCLERGISPHWDSGSHASQQLARQLGYRDAGEYDWWVVNP
jgi:GNAT superfamily N-acetyltransferase